jgi:hypothetical protein
MTVTCPRCTRSLSTADGADPPSYCMYCGHKLRDDAAATPRGLMHTASFTPTADGSAPASTSDSVVPIAPEPTPKVIGGYRLLRLLGSGGMGTVYEAEAPVSGNRVAVKLLSSRLSSSPTSVERFKQEGRLASQVAHPRCVFVLAADTDGGRPYIVMELMPGETLKDAVDKRGPLPPDEAVTRILDVIDGLAEAHRVGMIHRDMKPSNCFLTSDNRVKVGDFGLSKSLTDSRDRHLTQSGAFLGTVLFASPEQIRGEPLDYGSDVYSVCATLYYLLCGEAPYHHESVTAALAKAISEDAPPVCQKRPGISRGLEAVVMKGLERDRDRRWQSLDDLREALVNLLPSRQHPARPRALVGAYILDRIAVSFLIVPAELLRISLVGGGEGKIDVFELRWLAVAIMLAYFAVGEGVFGATPGKWLLGLRVSRLGQTEPPGVWRALLRTVVFHILLLSVFIAPEFLVAAVGPVAGGVLGGALFLAGAAGLLVQFRKRWGYRGLHDFASQCHVTQKPLPARKLRLPVKHPTPLQATLPAPADPLPETVGGYAVHGRVAVDPSGEQVWVGEDRALARTVLIWLKPDSPGPGLQAEAFRPTRLRRLGGGTLGWASQSFGWSAFAAPLGGPLTDAVHPNRPLPWADARFLLEQLLDELRAAEADGTTPIRLRIDQVWVEPNGRLQLLDCSPTAGVGSPAGSPFALLREVASLALEGRPRSTPGPVHAPVPPHAVPVLDRLFADGGYPVLADLHRELADTSAHRPEVTPAVRAAQLGIQAAVLSSVLAVLFVLAAVPGPMLAALAKNRADQADVALATLADPEKRAKLDEQAKKDDNRALAEALKSPRLVRRLEEFRDRKRTEAELRRSMLLGPQRWLLEQREQHAPADAEREAGYPVEVRELIQWAGAIENTPRGKSTTPWRTEAVPIFVILLAIPVTLVIGAAILRGGVSMMLAGIALVRADGRKATRRQCALRAALVWLPVAGLLFAAAAIQAIAPERVYFATALWLLAVALLPVYVVVALRFPTQPPQDRVTGTYLVPA